MVGEGRFIEVFIDTPLAVCEACDVKGMYARARRGEIAQFTRISDPYEPLLTPELVLTTAPTTPEANAEVVFEILIDRGFVPRALGAGADGSRPDNGSAR